MMRGGMSWRERRGESKPEPAQDLALSGFSNQLYLTVTFTTATGGMLNPVEAMHCSAKDTVLGVDDAARLMSPCVDVVI